MAREHGARGRVAEILSSGLYCLLVCITLHASLALAKEAATIKGKLNIVPGKAPVLESQGNSISLLSANESISETLKDPRNSGKQLEVKGEFRKDGSLDVSEFWVIHPDGLYKIIYYCIVCHITAFSPGNCMCCQEPTAPEEIPLTDPRVHHEEVKGPPRQS